MNKKMNWMLTVITLVALLVGTSAYAQTASTVKASIPFDFRIGNESLPAGVYAVSNIYGARVTLRSLDGRKTVVLMTNDIQANHAPADGKLVFTRFGELYFLSQIWTAGEEVGRTVIKSNAEKEMASRIAPSEASVLIAGKAGK